MAEMCANVANVRPDLVVGDYRNRLLCYGECLLVLAASTR